MARDESKTYPEQEKAVLASCLTNGLPWWQSLERVLGADVVDIFTEPEHRVIANAMNELALRDRDITIDSVADEVGSKDNASLLGPSVRTYLSTLRLRATLRSSADMVGAAGILQDSLAMRRTVAELDDIIHRATTGEIEVNELSSELRTLSGRSGGTDEMQRLGDVIQSVREKESMGVSFRIPTGIRALDRVIKGWEPGRLYVVGARPKVGKTTFATINSVLEALASGAVVVLASLEVGPKELWSKLVSAQAYVDQREIQAWYDGERKFEDFTAGEQEALINAEEQLTQADLWFIQSHECTNGMSSIISKTMAVRAKYPPETPMICFLDYLQLTVTGKQTTLVELTAATRLAKLSAMELNIPIVVLSQISRDGAEGGMPQPHNLRDSGSIEQDADCVILLNRPHLQDESEPAHVMDIWVAISRYTASGMVRAYYAPEFQTIRDPDDEVIAVERRSDRVERDDDEDRKGSKKAPQDPQDRTAERRAKRKTREGKRGAKESMEDYD